MNTNQPARVRSAIAPMHSEGRVSASQTSQVVAGHIVQLLEQNGDWWRVRSADNYDGWMHCGYLEPASGDELLWPLSLGVTVHEHDGRERALPVGARVASDATVVSGSSVLASGIAQSFPPISIAVVQSAITYYTGASYQWGGVTEWGCDCSGLVQSVYALHGCQLPRDAHQQADVGNAVAVAAIGIADALDAIAEADLLFFSDREDRRITHVGIALSGGRMLHSALGRGGVALEVLGSDEPYVQRLRANFVLARRVL
ncbi:MAG: SH3 domain-containing C40 family peptidase [Gemmatimonas sp.]